MRVWRAALIIVAFAAMASASFGGIRYEFQQIKRSSDARKSAVVVIGKAIIDGENSRVEYLEGSTTGAGNYILTTDGGKTTAIVDPANRTYFEHDNSAATQRIRNLDLQIKNFSWDAQMLGSGPEIAGFPTEHHRIILKYDLILTIGPLDMTQRIETTIDKYTTLAFGDLGATFFRDGLPMTGNAAIDQVIQTEATNTPGIPLRQTVRVQSVIDESSLPANSQIQIDPRRVQTTQMTVTSIERIGVKPGVFQIPASFTRIEGGVPSAAVGYLSPTTE